MQIMKKKNLLIIAAIASTVLAGCSSEDFAGEEDITTPTKQVPIDFGSYFKAMTRADITGAAAAELLNKQFVVSGYKGGDVSNIVFDNYRVVWEENSADKTPSNTDNWEYVDKTKIPYSQVTSQKIKYWDYSQPQYDFIAWSTGKKTALFEVPTGGIPAGSVFVSAITPNTATSATGAYSFTGKAADLNECYIADLKTVPKGEYGLPVTLRFRQLGTKVRVGIYETVPGYSVKDVKFYSAAAVDLVKTGDNKPVSGTYTAEEAAAENARAKLFTTSANEIYTEGTCTVYFPNAASGDNTAHVSFTSTATPSDVVDWGGIKYVGKEEGEKTDGNVFLGRTSNSASFAGIEDDGFYVVYLPNESGTNLNLRVNYTLESTDGSGEVITVKGATAQIPSIYTQWKPGYAYTYLFKISDKTNGHTGVYDPTDPDNTTVNSDPAGLYPITFDAVVVNAEEESPIQETITLVSTPSITSYQKGSTVVNNNEYKASTGDIYVTVNENNVLATLTDKAAIYEIPNGKTEAEVIDALQVRDDDATTIKGRSGIVLTAATKVDAVANLAADKYMLTNSVEYGVDGKAISVAADQALRFRPAAPVAPATKTYAFVYTQTAPTVYTDKFGEVTKAAGEDVEKLYRDFNLTAATNGDAKSTKTYYKMVDGTPTQKSVFLGQGTGNLYTDNAGNAATTTYAVSGTTYYYTIDGGTSYLEAHNVAYTAFGNTLFVEGDTPGTYVANTDATPQAGTAYYYYDSENNKYIYCVIMPEQVNGLYEYTFGSYNQCMTGEKAIAGHQYYDKYIQNNGVYYAKVIKVQ